MARYFSNWLQAYCDHTEHLEAPTNLHFFSGVAAIAGALRRQVWFDQGYFSWFPNFYIIIVGKPGIVAKSTSLGVAMDLLREVPGVHFGPSAMTWQALVTKMAGATEQVEINGDFHTQSCLTFAASELGTLLDFRNREMIDVLVDLWDGKTGSWEKMTKKEGSEIIVNPWIGIIAGTTPAWLTDNVPERAVGGGFTSRCLFVYGREKRQYIAYPKDHLPKAFYDTRYKLIADLEHISLLKGQYTLTPEAKAYGAEWYEKLWKDTPEHLQNERFEGYVARKQTHLHKLCMVLAASQRDELVITKDDFLTAETLLASLEDDMLLALDKVGRSASSVTLEQLVQYVKRKGKVEQGELYRYMSKYADFLAVQNMVNLATMAGMIKSAQHGNTAFIVYCET